jgi:NTP pyrophosphatase (non-canonical NTP hydrolase)
MNGDNHPVGSPSAESGRAPEHFNMLSPAQLELLACLAEECGEVVQVIGKIMRHGYDDWSPLDVSRTTNRANLERELGDLNAVCDRIRAAGDIKVKNIQDASDAKHVKLAKWTHHQFDSELAEANPALSGEKKP